MDTHLASEGYDLISPAMPFAVRPVAVPSITPLILTLPVYCHTICCQDPSQPRPETPAP